MAQARLAALGMHLRAHGFATETVDGGLVVRNSASPGCCDAQPTAADTIRCRPHTGDGGRYWFFTSWGLPIAEADRVTDALVRIKGYLGA